MEKRTKIRFFYLVSNVSVNAYKGTDVMLAALERLQADFPDEVEYVTAENMPFDEYVQLLRSSDVLLDQLYSYTPAMNALQAMAQGLVVEQAVNLRTMRFWAKQNCVPSSMCCLLSNLFTNN